MYLAYVYSALTLASVAKLHWNVNATTKIYSQFVVNLSGIPRKFYSKYEFGLLLI